VVLTPTLPNHRSSLSLQASPGATCCCLETSKQRTRETGDLDRVNATGVKTCFVDNPIALHVLLWRNLAVITGLYDSLQRCPTMFAVTARYRAICRFEWMVGVESLICLLIILCDAGLFQQ